MPYDYSGFPIGSVPGMPIPERLRAAQAPTRGPIYGSRHAVAAEHPASALVAMNVLQSGGNAIDAAIAASAVNVVTKPYATHLGGDAFALIWHRKSNTVECLNAGGRAPHRATLEALDGRIPPAGPRASTIPGLVDAWFELHQRHGSRPMSELLASAIAIANDGFPVSTYLAAQTAVLEQRTANAPDHPIRQVFLAEGTRRYRRSEAMRQPQFAETLAAIARDGRDGFYGGRAGRAIVETMRAEGGLIDEEDLTQPQAHWHEPTSATYRDCKLYEQAPPSQGLIVLMALNIIEHFPVADWGLASADSVHVMSEAIRLAFEDTRAHLADPLVADVPIDMLLSKDRAAQRAREIDMSRARNTAVPTGSDTTSFVVADEDTAVCFIQSVFGVWGSGVVIPGTGVLMNNRMLGFSADPAHPNCVAPGKRTVHTLNNFLCVRDGRLLVGGGTPGADFQVQSNVQTIAGVLDWRLDLHSAINAPRWAVASDGRLAMESRFPEETLVELERRGHRVHRCGPWDTPLARSQVIASLPDGGWAVASDLRSEGLALAY
jgi:gamma-glutamyltranspeptidase/glutathione hydrolase